MLVYLLLDVIFLVVGRYFIGCYMLVYWLFLQVNADMIGGLDDAESSIVGGHVLSYRVICSFCGC
jgi:hypothetical protein